MNAYSILIVIALVLFIIALIKPNVQLAAVGGILVCAALMTGRYFPELLK